MIVFLLAAGIGLSSAVTHFALGLKRPLAVQHVTFALMMLSICPFQYFVARFQMATSAEAAVETGRATVAAATAIITLFGVFVRQYTGVKVHPAVGWGFLAANGAWLAYDLIAPWGLVFSSRPSLPLNEADAPVALPISPAGLLWQGFNVLTTGWGAVVGWRLVWKGRRRSGLALALGASAVTITVAIDFVRDLLVKSWPFLGGFGIIVMALLLSAQLASDFRQREQRLAELVKASINLRDQLNTPLQTLHFGLEILPAQTPQERATISRLQRAVARLTKLERELRARSLASS